MRFHLLLTAAAAVLLLTAGSATAGCSDEIASLEKALSSMDAGMGPTAGADAADSADVEAQTAPAAGAAPGTEATPAMSEVAEGKATSPEDVQKQNEGQPTAADAAAADEGSQTSEVGRADSPGDASDLLAQAKEHEQAGREEDCLSAIEQARQHINLQ
jgi:hypothetical protein